MNNLTNKELISNFKIYLESKYYSKYTVLCYINDIEHFLNSIKSIIHITEDKVNKYLKQFEPVTARRKLASIKKLSKYCIKEKIIPSDVLEDIKLPSKKLYIPNIPTFDIVNSVLNGITDIFCKTLYLIILNTGARISSVINLKIEDINFNTNEIIYKTAKGNKPYTSFLDTETVNLIKQYIHNRTNGYVFLNLKNNKPETEAGARYRLRKILNNSYINPHSLRHAVATNMLLNGASLPVIQKTLNHSSITSTQVYINLSKEQQYNEVKKTNPFLKVNDYKDDTSTILADTRASCNIVATDPE